MYYHNDDLDTYLMYLFLNCKSLMSLTSTCVIWDHYCAMYLPDLYDFSLLYFSHLISA